MLANVGSIGTVAANRTSAGLTDAYSRRLAAETRAWGKSDINLGRAHVCLWPARSRHDVLVSCPLRRLPEHAWKV